MLFHLGALRRLNELGVLSRVTTVSAVSGGSLIAAFLAARLQPWPEDGNCFAAFEEAIASPVKRMAGKNIRNRPVLARLLPWNLLNSQAQVDAMTGTIHREISSMALAELPRRPHFVFCATDLPYAVNWVFERERMGDYQAGYAAPPHGWPLARAVAASACFPPVFSPLRPRLEPDALRGGSARRDSRRNDIVRTMSLSDGGVYDNMGLEPVWKNHAVLLVSDGGATFDAGPDRGFLWQAPRYSAVVSNQAAALRKRWLIAGFLSGEMTGAYWGIGSAAEHRGSRRGYPGGGVDEVISEVRTDLDAFSSAEQAVLENHGYVMADAAVERHTAGLISPGAQPFSLPHPEWMDAERVRSALRESGKRRLLGRG